MKKHKTLLDSIIYTIENTTSSIRGYETEKIKKKLKSKKLQKKLQSKKNN